MLNDIVSTWALGGSVAFISLCFTEEGPLNRKALAWIFLWPVLVPAVAGKAALEIVRE